MISYFTEGQVNKCSPNVESGSMYLFLTCIKQPVLNCNFQRALPVPFLWTLSWTICQFSEYVRLSITKHYME